MHWKGNKRSRWKTDQRFEPFWIPRGNLADKIPRIKGFPSPIACRSGTVLDVGRQRGLEKRERERKKLLNPIWISGPLNSGLISSKDISRSSFEKEPNRFDDGGGIYRHEGRKRKSGTRRRLIPTIHPSTYRKGMPTDRQLLSTRYPSKTYPLLLYVSVSPLVVSSLQRITNRWKNGISEGNKSPSGDRRDFPSYWEKNTVYSGEVHLHLFAVYMIILNASKCCCNFFKLLF